MIQIRVARSTDLAEITRIYNEAVVERSATADTEVQSLEQRAKWFHQFDDTHPIWVSEVDGRIVSYGCLFVYSPKDGYRFATEHSVYVSAESRGQGHGRSMLEHVLAEASRLGFTYILARIFAHNGASRKLHAALGFNELGLQRQIVTMDGNWYDVILMDRQTG